MRQMTRAAVRVRVDDMKAHLMSFGVFLGMLVLGLAVLQIVARRGGPDLPALIASLVPPMSTPAPVAASSAAA